VQFKSRLVKGPSEKTCEAALARSSKLKVDCDRTVMLQLVDSKAERCWSGRSGTLEREAVERHRATPRLCHPSPEIGRQRGVTRERWGPGGRSKTRHLELHSYVRPDHRIAATAAANPRSLMCSGTLQQRCDPPNKGQDEEWVAEERQRCGSRQQHFTPEDSRGHNGERHGSGHAGQTHPCGQRTRNADQ
jgi:hypothetical protein